MRRQEVYLVSGLHLIHLSNIPRIYYKTTMKLTSKMPLFLSLVIFLFLIFQKKRCCFPPVTIQLSSNGLNVPTITSSISVCCCKIYYMRIVSTEIRRAQRGKIPKGPKFKYVDIEQSQEWYRVLTDSALNKGTIIDFPD